MINGFSDISVGVLVVGALIACAIVVRDLLRRIGVPPLIGFILLGLLLRLLDDGTALLNSDRLAQIELLAQLGIFALLFRVGLESNLHRLIELIPSAALIWIVSMAMSGGLGFVFAYHLLGLGMIPSMIIAVALTATSVGVGVTLWQEAGAARSRVSALFVDVAELDDLSAVFLMILLFSVLPVLNGTADGSLAQIAGEAAAIALVKAVAFGALCFLFSRYAERHVTSFVMRFETAPDPMLLVVGIGVMIAAVASLVGFSLAIGALFAGLVFSRDPAAVRVDASFNALYELFVPFFFIGIGFAMEPGAITLGLGIGGVLLIAAIVGKVVGAGLPALVSTSVTGAALIGVSMVPRAEIAMVIMQQGRALGDWAVPADIFAGMVVCVLATCIVAPLALRMMLARMPQQDEPSDGGDR